MYENRQLISSIEDERKSHHDTIYCNTKQERTLKLASSVPPSNLSNIDNVRVLGLDVQTLPRIKHPIVCKKGEVFPLAKDFKNGEL